MAAFAVCCLLAATAAAEGCANAGFRTGPSARLPDCRAYERVSPDWKDGVDAVTLQPLYPAQAATCAPGEACALVYMNAAAAFAGALGNEVPNAYLASREAAGWRTTPLTPPTEQAPPNAPASLTYAFSSDLAHSVVRVPLQQLTDRAPPGVYNLFARDPLGNYSLLTAAPPSTPPKPGCGGCFVVEDVPAFAGASADFGHVIFEANDALVEGAPSGVENLYESFGESVKLVGVLPDGSIPPNGETAGAGIKAVTQRAHQIDGAISQDGSHVIFQAEADGGPPDPQQAGKVELYDRVNGASTVEVSAPASGAEPGRCETAGGLCNPGAARFWAASASGSAVFFTSKASLTKSSFTGSEGAGESAGNDLYRYEVAGARLTDLAPDHSDPNGAGVLGVVGASSDGTYVYFVAEGKLTGSALSGEPNLYVWHGAPGEAGAVSFIATLARPDEEEEANVENERVGPSIVNHSDVGDWAPTPRQSQAYVTPDGRHLAFLSVNKLTGYDNEDAISHEADHEVYEYSAQDGALVCGSCDPSGARPIGSAFIGAGLRERVSTPFHQPRALSDDGSRLFFTSPDPLQPGLSGGALKVFEYTNGAVASISGSGDGSNDVFLDASSSGGDVFFATREQLVPDDEDQLADVYDARVGGGLAQAPIAAPPCQASSCSSSPSPTFEVPISAVFDGPENHPSGKPKLTSAQLLAHALARCKKLHGRHRRRACIAAARRRYAARHKRADGHGHARRG